MILTNAMIDHLICARNRITDRTEDYIDTRAVDHIDAVLREIPVGDRNDVDLLLGRSCAQFPNIRTGWSSDAERAAVVEQARADVAELAAEKMAQFRDWQHGERGTGCAGNDAETCEAGGFG